MKMKGLFQLTAVFAVAAMIVTGCGRNCENGDCDDPINGGEDSGRGYAPGAMNGKEFVFNRDGKWNFSSVTNNSSTSVSINAEVAYDKSSPVCTYKKTGDNTAQYTLEFWHKAYVPYYGNYSYGYNYYSLNLTFSSASGGSYTGTRSNGSAKESRTGTFKLN